MKKLSLLLVTSLCASLILTGANAEPPECPPHHGPGPIKHLKKIYRDASDSERQALDQFREEIKGLEREQKREAFHQFLKDNPTIEAKLHDGFQRHLEKVYQKSSPAQQKLIDQFRGETQGMSLEEKRKTFHRYLDENPSLAKRFHKPFKKGLKSIYKRANPEQQARLKQLENQIRDLEPKEKRATVHQFFQDNPDLRQLMHKERGGDRPRRSRD